MNKELLKRAGLIAGIVLVFLALSYAFVPEVLTGKVLNQSDISMWSGMAQESAAWNAEHPDDKTAWTESMFGGMPNITIVEHNDGDWTHGLYRLLLTGKRPATYFFISMLGAFLLLLAFGVHPLLAAGAAIAVTFCSYNMQILQVGHNTKMLAIAFFPWVLAALVFTYRSALRRKKWLPLTLLGSVLFGLALSMQVKANHPQISYYLATVIVIYVIVLIVGILKDKENRSEGLKRFFISSALLLVLGICGMATNATKLLPTIEYTPYSMRGGTTASQEGDKNARKGLDIDFATAWSYGWEELPNLMIPNYNGGASSAPVNIKQSETYKLLKRAGQKDAARICEALPMYWGPQPFTAGPMYMGAITVFLFVLGLCYYKGRDKWWLVAASILAILFALGSHFMIFTKLCFKILPLYNKFRTVSMALVVLQVTLPVLGFLMLDSIVKSSSDPKLLRKQILTAGAITAGACLVLALAQAALGTFTADADANQQEVLVDAFIADRRHLLWVDMSRSVLFILAAALVLVWGVTPPKDAKKTFSTNKDIASARRLTASLIVCLLIVADLFTVGKRYLNDSHFVTARSFSAQTAQRPVDKAILRDTTLSYRVLDLTGSPFNNSMPSYWHKSIGGYSPAKLQRYQEFLENTLSGELGQIGSSAKGKSTVAEVEAALPYLPGLASMNTKYIILGDTQTLIYPYARGNAWFNDRHKGFANLVSYAPNCLKYEYTSLADATLIFSEVYYPVGWKLVLDGKEEIPIRVYEGDEVTPGALLRCADVPEGVHSLEMRFDPPSYRKGAAISRATSIILILVVLGSIAGAVVTGRKKEEE